MRFARPAVLALAGLLTAAVGACAPEGPGPDGGDMVVRTDTTDAALLAPGVIFRFGPATPEEKASPVYPPVVAGDVGQVSIYQGYFIRPPCWTPLAVEASRGDTITVRIWAEPDSAAPTPCPDEAKALGYSMLVGQFDPGTYAVRLIHDGDRARPTKLDTVYENITIRGR